MNDEKQGNISKQVICKECGTAVDECFTKCPYCGKPIMKRNRIRLFVGLGLLIATLILIAVFCLVNRNTDLSLGKPETTLSDSRGPIPSPVITPEPTPIKATMPVTTVFIESPEAYGLKMELTYEEFVDKYNQSIEGIDKSSKPIQINREAIKNMSTIPSGAGMLIEHDLGNANMLTLDVVGSKLYIRSIRLYGYYPKDETDRSLANCVNAVVLCLPDGTQFINDVGTAAKTKNLYWKKTKSVTELIQGVEYTFTSFTDAIMVKVNTRTYD